MILTKKTTFVPCLVYDLSIPAVRIFLNLKASIDTEAVNCCRCFHVDVNIDGLNAFIRFHAVKLSFSVSSFLKCRW